MPIQIYDTHTLIGVQEKLRPVSMYWTNLLFPGQVNFDTKFIDFDVVDEGRRVAPFVSPNVQGRVMREKGYETRKFEPAYLKPKHIIDPSRPLKRMAGEPYGGNMSAEARFNAHVVNQMQVHRDMIFRRFELMATEVVLDGSCTVSGEDYPTVNVDFQRPASLTVVPAVAWDAASGVDIVGDIDQWTTLVHQEAGRVVTRITMTNDVWPHFIADPKIEKLLDTRRGSRSVIESGPGNGEAAQYRGTLGASLEVWTYQDIYEDETGAKVNIMPSGAVVLTVSDIGGIRAFGAILDGKAGFRSMDIFPKMWENDDPAVVYLMSQSAPLMIPTLPEGTLRADVLTP